MKIITMALILTSFLGCKSRGSLAPSADLESLKNEDWIYGEYTGTAKYGNDITIFSKKCTLVLKKGQKAGEVELTYTHYKLKSPVKVQFEESRLTTDKRPKPGTSDGFILTFETPGNGVGFDSTVYLDGQNIKGFGYYIKYPFGFADYYCFNIAKVRH